MKFYFPPLLKTQLIHGAYYRGNCRNASLARWNAETDRFSFLLDDNSVAEIDHFEDDVGYDVFYPTMIEPTPQVIINYAPLRS